MLPVALLIANTSRLGTGNASAVPLLAPDVTRPPTKPGPEVGVPKPMVMFLLISFVPTV